MLKEAKRIKAKLGVALVLIENNRILLSRRFNTGTDDGYYICPIGGLEFGETASQAMIREAFEEVNIVIEPQHLKLLHTMHRLHHLPNGNHFIQIDLYFSPVKYDGVIKNNEPHKCDDLQFFPLEALPNNTLPFIRQMLSSIRSGETYSEFGWDKKVTPLHSSDVLTPEVYSWSAQSYDNHRMADVQLTEKIYQILQTSQSVLDVACGTGNYTVALANRGVPIEGLDISSEMLIHAKNKAPNLAWKEGSMESLPYQNHSFDAILSVNALHYVRHSLVKVFSEMKRVLKPGGKLLIYATGLEQCLQYWAGEYFPFFRELGLKILASQDELLQALTEAGFKNIKFEPFYISETTQDLYIYACKYRPHLYLNDSIRKCMTPFQYPEFVNEIEIGCERLKRDIESGAIYRVIAQAESSLGEGLLIQADLS